MEDFLEEEILRRSLFARALNKAIKSSCSWMISHFTEEGCRGILLSAVVLWIVPVAFFAWLTVHCVGQKEWVGVAIGVVGPLATLIGTFVILIAAAGTTARRSPPKT